MKSAIFELQTLGQTAKSDNWLHLTESASGRYEIDE
jgi:hypothetical protein